MARVKITLVCEECGQEFTHIHNCYNRDAADSYEEWTKENITVCPECYKKAKRTKERAAQEATAEAVNDWLASENISLSPLDGSEKQIAWANTIRLVAIYCIYNVKEQIAEKNWETIWRHINKYADSKWWIENRDYFTADSQYMMRVIQNDIRKEKEAKQ